MFYLPANVWAFEQPFFFVWEHRFEFPALHCCHIQHLKFKALWKSNVREAEKKLLFLQGLVHTRQEWGNTGDVWNPAWQTFAIQSCLNGFLSETFHIRVAI